ncbi:MAG: hypothetical protein D6806_17450 [Deltaproteobacteria bacterium]|nr:MAG: hypothetical protein D6806_17450 [Deltaproteobacteria bacterium]
MGMKGIARTALVIAMLGMLLQGCRKQQEKGKGARRANVAAKMVETGAESGQAASGYGSSGLVRTGSQAPAGHAGDSAKNRSKTVASTQNPAGSAAERTRLKQRLYNVMSQLQRARKARGFDTQPTYSQPTETDVRECAKREAAIAPAATGRKNRNSVAKFRSQ